MSTVNGEVVQSRGGTLSSIRRRYVIDASGESEPEEYVAEWVIANAPLSISGLVRGDIIIDEAREILDQYDVEVQYGETSRPAPPAATGSKEFRFNFQAQGFHAKQSLETILYATVLGSSATPTPVIARNFHGALNVVSDGGKLRVEGFQIEPPPEAFTLAYFPENAVVSTAYQRLVSRLCGTVNDAPYQGYDAGSLMLVSCSGGVRTDEDWGIDFGFGHVPTQADIPVGDIVIPTKDGLDLLWAFYGEDVDSTANGLVKKPLYAYVERVFRRENFDQLELPI